MRARVRLECIEMAIMKGAGAFEREEEWSPAFKILLVNKMG